MNTPTATDFLARRTGPGNRDIIVHKFGCAHAARLLGVGGMGVDYWTFGEDEVAAQLSDPMAYKCRACWGL